MAFRRRSPYHALFGGAMIPLRDNLQDVWAASYRESCSAACSCGAAVDFAIPAALSFLNSWGSHAVAERAAVRAADPEEPRNHGRKVSRLP